MTSSGRCNICGKVTGVFRYNNPRKDPNNINDGQWLCEEHDLQHAKDEMLGIEKLVGISMHKENRAGLKRKKKLW